MWMTLLNGGQQGCLSRRRLSRDIDLRQQTNGLTITDWRLGVFPSISSKWRRNWLDKTQGSWGQSLELSRHLRLIYWCSWGSVYLWMLVYMKMKDEKVEWRATFGTKLSTWKCLKITQLFWGFFTFTLFICGSRIFSFNHFVILL